MEKESIQYPVNFIYPDIKEEDRTYGATIAGPILREDGDWRDYLPPNEDQNVRGVESSACYIEAQQASIATIQEETFNIKDRNYSARFNALLSGGTEGGGDPVKGALSIKKDGLIPQLLMDFGKDIQSWDDFHSWKGVDKDRCIAEGKKEVAEWDKSYKIVAEKDNPVEIKYLNLKSALKRAPVPISVYAWLEKNGEYYKPEGIRDTHLTLAVYVDAQNRIHVRDTYYPYSKILAPNTNFEFALYWIVQKRVGDEEQYNNILKLFINFLQNYVGFLKKSVGVFDEFLSGIFSKREN